MSKRLLHNRINNIFIGMMISFIFISCENNYVPKPQAYFRIDLPEKEYRKLDSVYPYSFEYPVYSRIIHDKYAPDEKFWINVDFPKFKGKIHLSYKKVNNNLFEYLEDARNLAIKHIPKASAINERSYINQSSQVYGLIYEIKGSEAASPYQFYVTDSVNHFVRGALYFYVSPNNDSLAPVIDFIHKDIEHMINTFRWKQ